LDGSVDIDISCDGKNGIVRSVVSRIELKNVFDGDVSDVADARPDNRMAVSRRRV